MEKQNKLDIEISEQVAMGEYSNLVVITHSHAEFVLDFVNVMPNLPKGRVRSRIILAPEHAKLLLAALEENIAKYEAANGPIKFSPNSQNPPVGMPFGGPTALA